MTSDVPTCLARRQTSRDRKPRFFSSPSCFFLQPANIGLTGLGVAATRTNAAITTLNEFTSKTSLTGVAAGKYSSLPMKLG
jgi:hypothetical protein